MQRQDRFLHLVRKDPILFNHSRQSYHENYHQSSTGRLDGGDVRGNGSHGVRMDEGRWFLGGVLAADTGYPYGISAHIGFRPRWFFVNRDKFEMYLGLGAGYAFGREKWKLKVSADEETTATNYLHGARLTPELGLGFKLRNGDAIDIGLLCDVDFRFHGVSYFDSTIAKPGISIGYRF